MTSKISDRDFPPLYTDLDVQRPLRNHPGAKESTAEEFNDRSTIGTPPFLRDHARVIHSASFRRLQGKMQLFPTNESASMRNRLTHSLEVADIAMRIAQRINQQHEYFKVCNIDLHLVATAALAHDLGHPPFGHTGETILHSKVSPETNGYEGNAQTLRILTRLENRLVEYSGAKTDEEIFKKPFGLNLTYRTLASIIKYDRNIGNYYDGEVKKIRKKLRERGVPDADHESSKEFSDFISKFKSKPVKGYYSREGKIVWDIRDAVIPAGKSTPDRIIQTIECQIMDIADDIAYSTYDIEDAFIAGIYHPMDVVACDDEILEKIRKRVNDLLHKKGYTETVSDLDVLAIMSNLFNRSIHLAADASYALEDLGQRSVFVARSYRESLRHANDQLIRRKFTESLITRAVEKISVDVDYDAPSISKLTIPLETFLEIECLKAFNLYKVINSPQLKIFNRRAREIIESIYEAVQEPETEDIIASDRHRFMKYESDPKNRERALCDLISGMTDAEATSLYERIKSPSNRSIFTPW